MRAFEFLQEPRSEAPRLRLEISGVHCVAFPVSDTELRPFESLQKSRLEDEGLNCAIAPLERRSEPPIPSGA
ncbi:MAG: hypothetical protein OXU20_30705 [Myxococcales bacterium]|nr:hypothetical protein [Myxococcales bacterium]